MSQELQLNPGEDVIMSRGDVGYGGGMSLKNKELILTSQNLILIEKNLFGKTKNIVRFPLSDIMISDNRAQVKLGKKDLVTPSLDVYFKSGMERFIFSFEEDVKEWVNGINTLLTGQPEIYKKEDWLEEMAHVSDVVSGAARKMRKAFGIKSTEQVSCKCPSCGASLTGTEGETIQCPYCGSNFTF